MPALYSVTTPAGVTFATLLPSASVNQRLPSGPAAIPQAALPALLPVRYSVIVGAAAPAAVASSNAPSDTATNQRAPEPTRKSPHVGGTEQSQGGCRPAARMHSAA